MPSTRRQLPRVSVAWASAMAVISVVFGVWLGVALAPASQAPWWQGLLDFAKSPGAAAFAALLAAVIAFGGISKQVAVSRASLTHQKESAQADAWWAMFEWASDRAIPRRQDERPLPVSVSIRTLERLAAEATEQVQEAACAGVIDVLTPAIDAAGLGLAVDGRDAVASEGELAGFAALASYVESNAGTPAASFAAEAHVYEFRVASALVSLSTQNPRVKIYRNPPSAADHGADAIAVVDGLRVIIEIKAYRSAAGLPSKILQAIRRLRGRVPDADAILVITTFPADLGPDQESELRATTALWRGPEDDARLLEALLHASSLR
ncbi:restriction endonuclease [Demequina sp. TTPB684]|uniref:restriction endonuclease n=1 Tax=unclassified Demequina TaxID=2620311 RepID=UPI001CF17BBD|nr:MULTISPECIES: restriction endonuclease [unclassified Demequina]MCB2413265.1 restriction endonuclease [Demequina sp. TTPB684]UPU88725.1 restriction endonuclease [Demequina sp. TMPB413]